jgi:leukotriene-A4 hydrolase
VDMQYDTSLAQKANDLAKRWDASREVTDVKSLSFKEGDLDGFDSNQKGKYPVPPLANCSHLP